MLRTTSLRCVFLARLREVNIPSESLARLVLLVSLRFNDKQSKVKKL